MKVKKILLIGVLLCLFIKMPSLKAIAYVKPTDTTLDEEQNSIYMIGSVYSRVTSTPREPESSYIIYRINLKDNSKEVFYRGENLGMDRLTLSPDKKYIAVLKGYASFIKESELFILDKKEKKEVVSFKDEFGKYKWSPDGKKIIYITGGWAERGGFIPKGVWIYDIEAREKKKIAERATDIEWLTDDEIFVIDSYIRNKNTGRDKIINDSFVYNYKNAAIIKKNLNGLKFSLDGRYSITLSPENIGFIPGSDEYMKKILIDFYDLKPNKKIPRDKLNNIFKEPPRIYWESFFWAAGNKVVFWKRIYGERFREIVIGDIENNKILKTVKGRIVGVNGDRSKIVVFFDGKFIAVDVP